MEKPAAVTMCLHFFCPDNSVWFITNSCCTFYTSSHISLKFISKSILVLHPNQSMISHHSKEPLQFLRILNIQKEVMTKIHIAAARIHLKKHCICIFQNHCSFLQDQYIFYVKNFFTFLALSCNDFSALSTLDLHFHQFS